MIASRTDVLPGNPKAIAALCRVAERVEQQIERTPARASHQVWRSPTEARRVLASVKSLRRLAQAAHALADAHRQHTVPDLLDGIRTQGQLALLLADTPASELDQEMRKRLAAAAIPLARAQEASQQVQALLPAPDPRADLLEDIRLKRIEVGWTCHTEFPPTALARAVQAAAVQPGQVVFNPNAGRGELAEALAEAFPGVDVTMVEEGEQRRDLLLLLTQAYPGLHLEALERLAEYETRHERIVLCAPEGWRAQDVPVVQHAYHRLLLPGGRLVALMDGNSAAFALTSKAARTFRTWVEGLGGQVERLEGPSAHTTHYLLVLDKPRQGAELLPAEG